MMRAAVASSCYRQAEEWQVRAAQKGRRVVGGATDAGCKRQTSAPLHRSRLERALSSPGLRLRPLTQNTLTRLSTRLTSTRPNNFIHLFLLVFSHVIPSTCLIEDNPPSYDPYPRSSPYLAYAHFSRYLNVMRTTRPSGLYSSTQHARSAGTSYSDHLSYYLVVVWSTSDVFRVVASIRRLNNGGTRHLRSSIVL